MKNNELFDFIKNQACKKKWNGFSNFIYSSEDIDNSEIKNLDIKLIDGGDWSDDGKYDLVEGTFHVTSDDGHDFYIEYGQSRSGNYHSDYFYDEPELSFIEKEKYEIPSILYEFKYGSYTILCGYKFNSKDEYAKIDDFKDEGVIFNSVEEAINYINDLNEDYYSLMKNSHLND